MFYGKSEIQDRFPILIVSHWVWSKKLISELGKLTCPLLGWAKLNLPELVPTLMKRTYFQLRVHGFCILGEHRPWLPTAAPDSYRQRLLSITPTPDDLAPPSAAVNLIIECGPAAALNQVTKIVYSPFFRLIEFISYLQFSEAVLLYILRINAVSSITLNCTCWIL